MGGSSYWNCVSSKSTSEHTEFDIITGPLQCIFVTAGEYLELTEDQTSERHQELLAEFERCKKVKIWKGNYVLELKVCDLFGLQAVVHTSCGGFLFMNSGS